MMVEKQIDVGMMPIDIKISDELIPSMKLSWIVTMVAGTAEPFNVLNPDGSALPNTMVDALVTCGMFSGLDNDPEYNPFIHTTLYIHTHVNK